MTRKKRIQKPAHAKSAHEKTAQGNDRTRKNLHTEKSHAEQTSHGKNRTRRNHTWKTPHMKKIALRKNRTRNRTVGVFGSD